MDSFEFNKIAGAILATLLGLMAVTIVSETIYEPAPPAKPGYVVAVATPAQASGGQAAPAVEPIAVRLVMASVDNGADIAKKCLACHTLMKGEPTKIGPNLWGVLGGPSAHIQGFNYSDAMLAEHMMGLTWTYDNLDKFLTSPKMFIPGTAMGFAGLPSSKDRADVIAYIRTLSESPIALPPVPVAAAATPPPSSTAPSSGNSSGAPQTAQPPGGASAQLVGDPAAGEMVFKRCSICHKVGPDAANSIGPVLNGVIGRPAGTYPGYTYSTANKSSGVVWTAQALADYLPNPQAYIPGTKMPFMLADPQDVANVIAYLKQFDGQGNKAVGTP